MVEYPISQHPLHIAIVPKNIVIVSGNVESRISIKDLDLALNEFIGKASKYVDELSSDLVRIIGNIVDYVRTKYNVAKIEIELYTQAQECYFHIVSFINDRGRSVDVDFKVRMILKKTIYMLWTLLSVVYGEYDGAEILSEKLSKIQGLEVMVR